MLKAGVGKVIFDIDGLTQDVYEKYRVGGELDKVLRTIRLFVDSKKTLSSEVILEGRMIVNKYNEHQVSLFEDFVDELGLDRTSLHKMQVNSKLDSELLPNEESLRYQNYLIPTEKSVRPQPCVRLYTDVVIDWNLNIPPCCLTYGEEAIFSTYDEILKTGWFSNSKYDSARKYLSSGIIESDSVLTICHFCKNQLGADNPDVPYYKDTFALAISD